MSVLGALILFVCVQPQDPTKPLEFKFRQAGFEGVAQYLSRMTGWVFVNEAGFQGKIDAVSNTPIPKEQVLDFLNTALRPHGVAAVRVTDMVVKIVTLDEAKRKNTKIGYGIDPTQIQPSDQLLTQIVPFKTLSLNDFDQGLKPLVPTTATIARDQANNALIMTDSAENIRRFLDFVSRIDGADSILKHKIIKLKHADVAEASRILGEFIRRDSTTAGNSPVKAVKIITDPRTNALVITATEENLKLLETLIPEIDKQTGDQVRIKSYTLKGAAAGDVSAAITNLLKPEGNAASAKIKSLTWWDQDESPEILSSYPIKALADPKANTLIVTGTCRQLELIDRVIQAMDFDATLNVHTLKFADAKALAAILTQMVQADLPIPRIQADERTNTILVSATEDQQKLLNMVIEVLDRQVKDSLQFKRYELANADPTEITDLLSGVFKDKSGALTKPVDAVVNRRTNTILVKAPAEYFSIIDELVLTLDRYPREEEVTYVARLKSVDAKSVSKVLSALSMGKVISELSDRPTERPQPLAPPEPKQEQPQNPTPNMPSGTKPIPNSTEPSAPQTKIETDDASNILVIRVPKKNLEMVKKLIKDLDQHRPQVLIKVMIGEVSLKDDIKYGVEGFWETQDGKHRLKTSLGTGVSGFTYLLTSDRYEAKLQALREKGLLNVLATPRILALDNVPAKFTVGKRVPHITDSRESPFGAVFNTVQYAEVGVILRVTPKIYSDGLVLLTVNPEVSDVAAQAEAVQIGPGVSAPTFLKNSVETSVTVKTGQTAILGGLIRDSEEESTSGVPLLEDIPVLGNLFSRTGKTKTRREMMIFITPYVVFSQMELEELTRLETAKMRLTDTRNVNQEARRWLDDLKR